MRRHCAPRWGKRCVNLSENSLLLAPTTSPRQHYLSMYPSRGGSVSTLLMLGRPSLPGVSDELVASSHWVPSPPWSVFTAFSIISSWRLSSCLGIPSCFLPYSRLNMYTVSYDQALAAESQNTALAMPSTKTGATSPPWVSRSESRLPDCLARQLVTQEFTNRLAKSAPNVTLQTVSFTGLWQCTSDLRSCYADRRASPGFILRVCAS